MENITKTPQNITNNPVHDMTQHIVPRLVSKKTMRRLTKAFDVPKMSNSTWIDNLYFFYKEYIRPNLFGLIVLFLMAIFLIVKYLLKQEKDEKNERQYNLIKKKIKQLKKKILQQKLLTQHQSFDPVENNYVVPPFHQDIDLQSNNTQTSHKSKYDDDLYYRASDVEPDIDSYDDEQEDRPNDEFSYYGLSKDYEKMLQENDGSVPEGMLRDAYEQKKLKTVFDKLAMLV